MTELFARPARKDTFHRLFVFLLYECKECRVINVPSVFSSPEPKAQGELL